MGLQEAIKNYRKAKQATKTAMTRVAESRNMISSDKAEDGSCVFYIKESFVDCHSECLAMSGDVKYSPFCSGCRYKNKRIAYEQNQTLLKKALIKEFDAKYQIIQSVKDIFVKSK